MAIPLPAHATDRNSGSDIGLFCCGAAPPRADSGRDGGTLATFLRGKSLQPFLRVVKLTRWSRT
jgi:hypothetical protein